MNYFTNDDIMRLESKAAKIRKEVVKMLCMAKMGHPGGSLSEVEILTTLYYHILNIDPKNPTDPHRDRLYYPKDMEVRHCIRFLLIWVILIRKS